MTHPSPVDPQLPEEVPARPSAGNDPFAPQQPLVESEPGPAPQYSTPPPLYPPAPYAPEAQPPGGSAVRSNAIGILSLIFGAAALLFGLIPFAGIFIGGLFGTAAIVLGIIGIIKSNKVLSIIGIVLSVVATILSFAITSSVAEDVADDLEAGVDSTSAEEDADAGEADAAEDAGEDAGDEAAEPDIAGVGDPVVDGDFEFTVGGFEEGVAEVGDEYLNEKAQGEFVIIELAVKNIGSESSYFSDGDQKLFDTDGNEYSANSSAGIYLEDNDIWLTEINPGNQVEGRIVFDVPAGTELAKLELHDSMFSGGIEVSLS